MTGERARVVARVGERERAIKWAERASEQTNGGTYDPFVDVLRERGSEEKENS